MSLPFTGIPDVLAPDDVKSYQHMNRVVDRANDAEDALNRQHWPDGVRGGQHLGEAPVPIAVLIVRPPSTFTAVNEHVVKCSAGYVDAAASSWEIVEQDVGGALARYARFRVAAPGNEFAWTGAEVQSGFNGTPAVLTGNLLCIHPLVRVSPGSNFGASVLEVLFGETEVGLILQFCALIYGARRGQTTYTEAP